MGGVDGEEKERRAPLSSKRQLLLAKEMSSARIVVDAAIPACPGRKRFERSKEVDRCSSFHCTAFGTVAFAIVVDRCRP